VGEVIVGHGNFRLNFKYRTRAREGNSADAGKRCRIV